MIQLMSTETGAGIFVGPTEARTGRGDQNPNLAPARFAEEQIRRCQSTNVFTEMMLNTGRSRTRGAAPNAAALNGGAEPPPHIRRRSRKRRSITSPDLPPEFD